RRLHHLFSTLSVTSGQLPFLIGWPEVGRFHHFDKPLYRGFSTLIYSPGNTAQRLYLLYALFRP
ncbi:MAG: hypothetical protein KKD01_13850, partial [Proteobacteria bacterium]|nr:hypothetical protein [Pseudomonadota bacterium]MBU1420094.1 hypothetical protein [Pseudomonadota bacterium]MBU1455804.1 hypothetical protein [Pseudomonadota bacterium]